MFKHVAPALFAAHVLLFTRALAQSSCSASLTPNYPAPSVASGYQARLIATGLTSPRDIIFDANDNLLVVEAGRGISSHSLAANSACVSIASSHDVVLLSSLNHGIALSLDGHTLYASDPQNVYAWPYNVGTSTTTGGSTTIVNNMDGTDHNTRPLVISRKAPGIMVVERGSLQNIDPQALDITTGVSQIKAFNITGITSPYDYPNSGTRLAWGIRNEVGITEHPVTGGIWGVENEADQITKTGVDVHTNNPGEKLNFFGYLDGTPYAPQGSNYGYPLCFPAWDPSEIPNNNGLQVGQQFAIDSQSGVPIGNDTYCRNSVTPPRLVFQAHMAPLDILFDGAGTTAYVTFHGSWDRSPPVGYMLTMIKFANGQPIEPSTSTTAAIPLMANQNTANCPTGCFRPVGLAWDSQGRLYLSSDATGEIYVITAANGAGIGGVNPSGVASSSVSSTIRTSTTASSTTVTSATSASSTGTSTSAVGTPITTTTSRTTGGSTLTTSVISTTTSATAAPSTSSVSSSSGASSRTPPTSRSRPCFTFGGGREQGFGPFTICV